MKIIKLKISKRILRYMKDIIRKLKEQKFITKVDVSEDDYKDDITQTGDQDEIIKYVESKYEPERPEYPITKESNATLMSIMYNCKLAASEDFMTWDEVEAVTDDNIKPDDSGDSIWYFKYGRLTDFNEFEYFTNVKTLDTFEGRSLGIKSITLPKSINSINTPGNSTKLIKSLTSLKVSADNHKYDSRENCNAIIETSSNKLILGCRNTVIPDSVTSMGDNCFYWCEYLTSITIPDSVTSMGDKCFGMCVSLTSVTIPNSVTSIGHNCFVDCDALTSVTILAKTAPSIMSDSFDSGVTIKVPKGATGYDTSNWSNYTIEYMNE